MGSLSVNLLPDRLDSLEQPRAASTSSTPKLTFKPLPKKPDEPLGMLTPPLNAGVSIPFLWELEPGKPRPYTTTKEPEDPTATKTAARCLELPPRLLAPPVEGKVVAGMTSPTTVLDGPDSFVGPTKRSLSSTLSFRKLGGSFRRGISPERDDKVFGSMRWEVGREKLDHDGGGGGDCDVLAAAVHGGGSGGAKVKITRVRRGRSFLGLSHSKSSNLLANIYEGLKHAVPWRRRQEKTIRNHYFIS